MNASNTSHIAKITGELGLTEKQVSATAALLEEGATVPFIARYRKEATGTLDEVEITAIRDRLLQLAELDKRREAILKSLEERGQLTEQLKDRYPCCGEYDGAGGHLSALSSETQDKGDHSQRKRS